MSNIWRALLLYQLYRHLKNITRYIFCMKSAKCWGKKTCFYKIKTVVQFVTVSFCSHSDNLCRFNKSHRLTRVVQYLDQRQCCSRYCLEDSIFVLKIKDSILSCIFKILLKSILTKIHFEDTFCTLCKILHSNYIKTITGMHTLHDYMEWQ